MKPKTYISFDWALKRLLRDKANFDVLEGFLSTLLEHTVRIRNLLESESNKESEYAKSNRVDLLCENEKGELIIIEVQGESEISYFQRILFGTSRLLSEYINQGDNYAEVKKIYSVNIVYFDLGQGKDVVYHGKTEFLGVRNHDVLQLSSFQRQKFQVDEVYQLFPEYYILKVNDFNQWSKVPLEQWLYFLANSEIPEDADAPGLQAAREKMRYMQMSQEERMDYDRYIDNRVVLQGNIDTARYEGRMAGRAEGRAEGVLETAQKMKALGVADSLICQATGLDVETVASL